MATGPPYGHWNSSPMSRISNNGCVSLTPARRHGGSQVRCLGIPTCQRPAPGVTSVVSEKPPAQNSKQTPDGGRTGQRRLGSNPLNGSLSPIAWTLKSASLSIICSVTTSYGSAAVPPCYSPFACLSPHIQPHRQSHFQQPPRPALVSSGLGVTGTQGDWQRRLVGV